MEDTKTGEKYQRRRKISLKMTVIVLLSYAVTVIATIIAKFLDASSIAYPQILGIGTVGIMVTLGFIVLISSQKIMSLRFTKIIYFSQFGVWLILFVLWVAYINEARVVGLILATLALSFLLSAANLIYSLAISALVCALYSLGTYWGIRYLGQDGKLSSDLFYVVCFLPSAVLISFMAGQFNQQKEKVKQAKRTAEKSLGSLENIIQYLAEKCNVLKDQSDDLLFLSSEMSGNMNKVTVKTNNVTADTDEMSEKINSVAAAINQASDNITLIASSAEEITTSIQEISKSSEKAKGTSSQAVTQSNIVSEKVQQLGDVAGKIGKITEVISEISEQTNLLALNATIEAARAGESGRGFAVVANEIKELARQTADATEQIRKQITGIQQSTTESVEEILQNVTVINQIDEIISAINMAIEDQSENTEQIAKNVAHSSQAISIVKGSAVNTSTVAQDIAKVISEVNQDVNAISGNSSYVHNSADNLRELAKNLKNLIMEYTSKSENTGTGNPKK